MRFPESRTEILDQIAVFVVDKSMTEEKKLLNVRMALMHWNHVDDKSLPPVAFEGFEVSNTNPSKDFLYTQLQSLYLGAEDYIFDRCGDLDSNLVKVAEEIRLLSESSYKPYHQQEPFDYSGFSEKMNDLLVAKEKIVGALEKFNFSVVDRVVEFSFDANQFNTNHKNFLERLKERVYSKKGKNGDEDFESSVDVIFTSGTEFGGTSRYIVKMYMKKEFVKPVVDHVIDYMCDTIVTGELPIMSISEHHKAMPNFKDINDIERRHHMKMKNKRKTENEVQGYEP